MYSLVNTRISIYRGTSTNEFGDVIEDNTTPIHTGILAFLTEAGTIAHDMNEPVPRVVRVAEAIVPANTDVLTRDRISDDVNGGMYWVRSANHVRSPGFTADIKLSLEKVD